MPTREKDVRVEGRSRPRARKEHRELSISKAPASSRGCQGRTSASLPGGESVAREGELTQQKLMASLIVERVPII